MKVKFIVKNHPEFLSNYRVVNSNTYISSYGDEYLILGVRSRYGIFTEIICTLKGEYLSLGHESDYSKTLETVERLSLLADCERLLNSIAA
jgi:hypothetical protein